MRKDVKVGMALALAVVLVAGWYYTRDSSDGQSIPLAGAESSEITDDSVQSEPDTTPIESQPVLDEPVVQTPTDPSAENDVLASADDAGSQETPVDTATTDSVAMRIGTERSASLLAAEPGEESDGSPDPFDLASAFSESAEESDENGPAPIVRAPEPTPAPTPKPVVREASPNQAQPRAEKQDGGAAVETYTVQAGDTFAVLAEIYYGSQQYTRYLMDANPQIENPQQLRAGITIRIPPLPKEAASRAVARQAPSTTEGKRVYVVKDGDSFYRIAKRELGKGSRWEELFKLNKDVVKGNAQGLRPGMVIMLPPQ